MKFYICLSVFVLFSACNPETIPLNPISIIDHVRIDPIKDSYQLNDTIWLISNGISTIKDNRTDEIFSKSKGLISYGLSIIRLNNQENNNNIPFVDIYNTLDISKSSSTQEKNLLKFNIQFGCKTMSDSIFRIAIILKQRGIFVLNPGTSTNYVLTIDRMNSTCPKFYLNQSYESNQSNASIKLKFNHDINAHYLQESPLEDKQQRLLEDLTRDNLLYWIKVD